MNSTSGAVLVAFGVVVLTTLGNTLLEWFRQHLTNRHDAEVLRRGLIEELRQAKKAADTNTVRAGEPPKGQSFLVPLANGYPIYEAHVGRLGILNADQVSAVVRAYAMLNAIPETLAVIGTFTNKPGSPVNHAVVDGEWAPVLSQANRDLSADLGRAIEALGGSTRDARALDQLPKNRRGKKVISRGSSE